MADGATVRNGTGDRVIKPLLRALALGVGPVVMALGLGMVGWSAPVEKLTLTSTKSSCTQPPAFKPGYQAGENYVVAQGEGFKFRAESWLQAELCSAGTLNITADGELAGDENPQLTVVLDGAILDTPSFDQERTAQLPIPRAGRLYLGYFNDYYLADIRKVTLTDIDFIASDCEGFKNVVVPKETGGFWKAATHVATLVRAVPMTLTPCAAGEMTLRVIGREGKGAFPLLTFEQAGKTLQTLNTTADLQKVRLDVSAAPLTITLTNPYNEKLADRNLNVRKIEFIPSQP